MRKLKNTEIIKKKKKKQKEKFAQSHTASKSGFMFRIIQFRSTYYVDSTPNKQVYIHTILFCSQKMGTFPPPCQRQVPTCTVGHIIQECSLLPCSLLPVFPIPVSSALSVAKTAQIWAPWSMYLLQTSPLHAGIAVCTWFFPSPLLPLEETYLCSTMSGRVSAEVTNSPLMDKSNGTSQHASYHDLRHLVLLSIRWYIMYLSSELSACLLFIP